MPGRLALNGHIDVVGPGNEPWARDPFSGALVDGRLHGRGSVDMKGAVIAALHALAAIRRAGADAPEVVLQAVPSEEDGGLGTFAALEADDDFDAALLPEPTGLRVVCAQAGALTFRGVVRGRSAHAAERLAGCSALDRYVRVHLALAGHEVAVNAGVTHPLMRELELPYPLLVGRIKGGDWSSQVPDRRRVRGPPGRAGRRRPRRRPRRAAGGRGPRAGRRRATLRAGLGGRRVRAWRDADRPPLDRRRCAARCATRSGASPLAGVPWGADMRLFTARGIPAVMVGTTGIERAHAVDEFVALDELATVARTIIRAVLRWTAFESPRQGVKKLERHPRGVVEAVGRGARRHRGTGTIVARRRPAVSAAPAVPTAARAKPAAGPVPSASTPDNAAPAAMPAARPVESHV